MNQNFSLFAILFFISNFLYSQNTIGLLHNTNEAYDGYTLFTPELSNSVFLIDNCGNSVNTWTFNGTPRATCYLLENGNLLRTGSNGLEIRDWDSNLIWEFNLLTEHNIRQHHDIEPLPNGNILCLVSESIDETNQIALGKNPALLNGSLKAEKIIEIEPVGSNAINIVWEWSFLDHLIQDFDASKNNFGNVAMHPELVDFNYDQTDIDHSNWLHTNGIDYNSELDQIIFSSRTLSEIYIIDHSTTTTEAASHTGGNQNKGGDFLWRWGNPQVYRQGTAADQKLFNQHDPKWTTDGFINEKKITVFNNNSDGTETFSSIHIISPILDANNNYVLQNDAFLPTDYFWSWSGDILGEAMHGLKKCGVIGLENGNMLLCETNKGRMSEIAPNGDVVWIYRNPVGTSVLDQFATDFDIFGTNSIFRGEKYPKTYTAFTGRDLTPQGILEDVNSNSEDCNLLSITEFNTFEDTISFNNPAVNNKITFHTELKNTMLSVYNTVGQIILEVKNFNGKELVFSNLKTGIHFIKFEKENTVTIKKVIIK